MALVQLSDVIDVEVFDSLPGDNDTTLNALMASGIVARSPEFDAHANAPGKVGELIQWNDLDNSSEPNFSDDTENAATPKNVDQKALNFRKVHLNEGWKAADLTRELQTGEDAMERVRSRVDHYWSTQFQNRLIASCNGILADNVANDSSDMVIDITVATDIAPTSAHLFSRQAFSNALFTMGDHFDEVQAIAVHSVVYQNMVDADDITEIPDSQGTALIPFYMGKRVIVDDNMPVVDDPVSTDPTVLQYTSILFGVGSFAFGSGNPLVPTAVERVEAQGQGGGVETLWSRKTWLIQPAGFSFLSATLTSASYATNAQLALAANWDRVATDRKSIPMTFLITNG